MRRLRAQALEARRCHATRLPGWPLQSPETGSGPRNPPAETAPAFRQSGVKSASRARSCSKPEWHCHAMPTRCMGIVLLHTFLASALRHHCVKAAAEYTALQVGFGADTYSSPCLESWGSFLPEGAQLAPSSASHPSPGTTRSHQGPWPHSWNLPTVSCRRSRKLPKKTRQCSGTSLSEHIEPLDTLQYHLLLEALPLRKRPVRDG